MLVYLVLVNEKVLILVLVFVFVFVMKITMTYLSLFATGRHLLEINLKFYMS